MLKAEHVKFRHILEKPYIVLCINCYVFTDPSVFQISHKTSILCVLWCPQEQEKS